MIVLNSIWYKYAGNISFEGGIWNDFGFVEDESVLILCQLIQLFPIHFEGIVLVTKQEECVMVSACVEADVAVPRLYHMTENADMETFLQVALSTAPSNVYILGRQGKSRHTQVWSLSTLLHSNSNLVEIDPKRDDLGEGNFKLPTNGISQTLCNKMVVLWN